MDLFQTWDYASIKKACSDAKVAKVTFFMTNFSWFYVGGLISTHCSFIEEKKLIRKRDIENQSILRLGALQKRAM